jgi:hypothetical protein
VISDWTKNLKAEEKERFKNSVYGSKLVLDRLDELLLEYEHDLEKGEIDYNSPNWDYRQADANGYRRCLKKIRTLITLDQG